MSDDSPQSPPRRSTIDSEGSPPPSPVAMQSSTSQPEDGHRRPRGGAPRRRRQPLPPRQPSPRRTDRQSLSIDAPPPENGTSPSLASPQAAPEMTVDQDEGDVYGGFRRRFKLKKSRSTEPWSTTRKPRLPAIKRRIASGVGAQLLLAVSRRTRRNHIHFSFCHGRNGSEFKERAGQWSVKNGRVPEGLWRYSIHFPASMLSR